MEWKVAGYVQDPAHRQETSNTEIQGGNKKAADYSTSQETNIMVL